MGDFDNADQSIVLGNRLITVCKEHSAKGGHPADVLTGMCHAFSLLLAGAAGTPDRIESTLALAFEQLRDLVPMHMGVEPGGSPAPANDDAVEVVSVPVLRTINQGVSVKRPDGELAPAEIGPYGSVSVGPGHVPTFGGAVYVALHDPDGTTLVLTMGGPAFNAFARLINYAAEALSSGAFSTPEAVN